MKLRKEKGEEGNVKGGPFIGRFQRLWRQPPAGTGFYEGTGEEGPPGRPLKLQLTKRTMFGWRHQNSCLGRRSLSKLEPLLTEILLVCM